jgi:L-threonylcarbamoyladenylate synthase
MIALNADRTSPAQIDRAVAILRAGGLVAFPTETVYGLGGRALDPAALARIFAAKGRPAAHPLIAHVLGVSEARALAADWSRLADRLAEAFWPGPLTLVVPRAPCVPLELTGGGNSVGIRAPAHRIARALLQALGEPIAAPSANRYQTLSPTTAAHVAASLGDRVDLILDGGPCSAGIESTVIDLGGEAPVILRPGALDFPTLAAVAPTLVDTTPRALDRDAERPSPGMDRRHYAPRTPLVIAPSRSAALLDAARRVADGQRVALLLLESEADAPHSAYARVLGPDPGAYGRQLFAALHDLDAGGFDVIVAEPVPDTPPWRAIADRLRRAGVDGPLGAGR